MALEVVELFRSQKTRATFRFFFRISRYGPAAFPSEGMTHQS